MINIRFIGIVEIVCKLKVNLGWSKLIIIYLERFVLKVFLFYIYC